MSRPSWRAQGRPSGAASVPARSRSCDIARSRAWHEVPVWPGACLRGLPDTDDVDGDRVEREATALDAAVCRLDSERVRGRGPRLQVNWERCPQRRRRSNNKRCNNSAVHLDVQDHGRSHRTPDAAYARVVGELGFEPRDVHLVPRLCPGVASQRDLLVRACCRGGQSAGAADTGDDRAAGYSRRSGIALRSLRPCVALRPLRSGRPLHRAAEIARRQRLVLYVGPGECAVGDFLAGYGVLAYVLGLELTVLDVP